MFEIWYDLVCWCECPGKNHSLTAHKSLICVLAIYTQYVENAHRLPWIPAHANEWRINDMCRVYVLKTHFDESVALCKFASVCVCVSHYVNNIFYAHNDVL